MKEQGEQWLIPTKVYPARDGWEGFDFVSVSFVNCDRKLACMINVQIYRYITPEGNDEKGDPGVPVAGGIEEVKQRTRCAVCRWMDSQ